MKEIQDYEILNKLVNNILDAPGMGGNISVKSDNVFVIKSSGQDLKKDHTVSVETLDEKYSWYISKDKMSYGKEYEKPSMEWEMHKNIPSKYVIHYHPIYVLPYLCTDYEFSYGTVIDYIAPGKKLADKIKEIDYLENIIFLRNHGVVIHSNSLEEIELLYNTVKEHFFITNNNVYTPDDCVDSNNDELYLHRMYIALLMGEMGQQLTETEQSELLHCKDEVYRQTNRTLL